MTNWRMGGDFTRDGIGPGGVVDVEPDDGAHSVGVEETGCQNAGFVRKVKRFMRGNPRLEKLEKIFIFSEATFGGLK